jgi:hypothetical protein
MRIAVALASESSDATRKHDAPREKEEGGVHGGANQICKTWAHGKLG